MATLAMVLDHNYHALKSMNCQNKNKKLWINWTTIPMSIQKTSQNLKGRYLGKIKLSSSNFYLVHWFSFISNLNISEEDFHNNIILINQCRFRLLIMHAILNNSSFFIRNESYYIRKLQYSVIVITANSKDNQ
jgi:hypothetical protein